MRYWTYGGYAASKDEIIYNLIKTSILLVFFILMIGFYHWFMAKTSIGNRLFPEINRHMGDGRYSVKFRSSDVVDNKVVIPLFKNIYLDYHAKGDMNKQLLKMEIKEHPFNRLMRKKGKIIKKKNIMLWTAIFTFKDKPVDGELLVWWT